MATEDEILHDLRQGHFTSAVTAWRNHALEKGYFGTDIDPAWGLAARLLEARLIYLSLQRPVEKLDDLIERYRRWLLDQVARVFPATEISTERLALPDTMRVGHPEIDADHTALFDRANHIRDALRAGDRARAADLAHGLVDEILAHFAREEQVLFREGYPDARAHALYHTILRSKAEEIRQVLLGMLGDDRQAVVTFDMLISFLVNDPIAADMDFKDFFRNRGERTAPRPPEPETPSTRPEPAPG